MIVVGVALVLDVLRREEMRTRGFVPSSFFVFYSRRRVFSLQRSKIDHEYDDEHEYDLRNRKGGKDREREP